MTDNPFAALTLIAAPAILTNASSVLVLSTSNRLSRAVDLQRHVSAVLETDLGMDAETGTLRVRQMERAEQRAELSLRSLTRFYVSLGAFAATSLIALLGAALERPDLQYLVSIARAAALASGVLGVSGLASGCAILVQETRLTLQGLREAAQYSRKLYRGHLNSAASGVI